MTCAQAKKLRNGDPVIRRSDNRVLYVITTRAPDGKTVTVTCNDGETYRHADLR